MKTNDLTHFVINNLHESTYVLLSLIGTPIIVSITFGDRDVRCESRVNFNKM